MWMNGKLEGKNILIVDDDDRNNFALSSYIETLGMKISVTQVKSLAVDSDSAALAPLQQWTFARGRDQPIMASPEPERRKPVREAYVTVGQAFGRCERRPGRAVAERWAGYPSTGTGRGSLPLQRDLVHGKDRQLAQGDVHLFVAGQPTGIVGGGHDEPVGHQDQQYRQRDVREERCGDALRRRLLRGEAVRTSNQTSVRSSVAVTSEATMTN